MERTSKEQALQEMTERISKGFIRSIDVGPGWHELVVGVHSQLSGIDPDYHIHQVKEKFGGLRYYYAPSDKATMEQASQMAEIVRSAEERSWKICEECGAPGEIQGDQWVRVVLCSNCTRD